jgi:hypothetical protein
MSIVYEEPHYKGGLVRTFRYVVWERIGGDKWQACGSFDSLSAARERAIGYRLILPMGEHPNEAKGSL